MHQYELLGLSLLWLSYYRYFSMFKCVLQLITKLEILWDYSACMTHVYVNAHR